MYRRKFRERLGELTPRNLDHPVPVGLVDIGGRRALIYGNPWRGLSSHPVPVLLPARETTSTVHWPMGCVDGAASFQTQILSSHIDFTQTHSSSLQHEGKIKLFLAYVKIKIFCFVMQRLHVSDPRDRDMADTVSLLNRLASIAWACDKKELNCSQGLPLVLFTESWTSHRQWHVDPISKAFFLHVCIYIRLEFCYQYPQKQIFSWTLCLVAKSLKRKAVSRFFCPLPPHFYRWKAPTAALQDRNSLKVDRTTKEAINKRAKIAVYWCFPLVVDVERSYSVLWIIKANRETFSALF